MRRLQFFQAGIQVVYWLQCKDNAGLRQETAQHHGQQRPNLRETESWPHWSMFRAPEIEHWLSGWPEYPEWLGVMEGLCSQLQFRQHSISRQRTASDRNWSRCSEWLTFCWNPMDSLGVTLVGIKKIENGDRCIWSGGLWMILRAFQTLRVMGSYKNCNQRATVWVELRTWNSVQQLRNVNQSMSPMPKKIQRLAVDC